MMGWEGFFDSQMLFGTGMFTYIYHTFLKAKFGGVFVCQFRYFVWGIHPLRGGFEHFLFSPRSLGR